MFIQPILVMHHQSALRFHKFSPGGNTTILVTDPVAAPLRAAVAAELMGEHHVHAEQVGFVTLAGACPRIDMMGGEFCGNACRSLAALLALKHVLHAGPGGLMSGEIASSGVSGTLPVRVVHTPHGPDAAVRMPLPPSAAPSPTVPEDATNPAKMAGTANMKGTGENHPTPEGAALQLVQPLADGLDLVRLPGIAHLLLDASAHPFPDDWQAQARMLIARHGLDDEPAAGCIWFHGPLVTPSITPVVRVRDTGSILLESACGSGSLAYGLLRAAMAGGETALAVRQPSGAVIRVSVSRRDGLTPEAWIGGTVRHVASGTAYLYGDQHA